MITVPIRRGFKGNRAGTMEAQSETASDRRHGSRAGPARLPQPKGGRVINRAFMAQLSSPAGFLHPAMAMCVRFLLR